MFTHLNIPYAQLSTQLLIEIANALANEIDEPATGYEHSRDANGTYFIALCKVIESRGIVLADYVRCPESL